MPRAQPKGVFIWRDVEVCVQAERDVLDACAGFLAVPCAPAHDVDSVLCAGSDGDGYAIKTARSTVSFPDHDTFLLNLAGAISCRILAATHENTLHAGAFVIDDRAILFSGPAETGKTTMACTALTEGHTAVGDDWLRVSDHRVSAFPKPIMPRGSCTVFPGLQTVAGELDGEKRALISRSTPGMASCENDYDAGLIALLQPGFGDETRLKTASRTRSLSSFIEQILTRNGVVLDSLGLLEKLWQEGRVLELEVGRHQTKAAIHLLIDRL